MAGTDDKTSMLMSTFGDTLHDILVRTIEDDRSPGLLTLQFPTGSGKSYGVERALATLASRLPDNSPPIIFVTPQKKNIPDAKKIAELCRKAGYEPGPHDIQRLLSAPEMVARTATSDILDRVPTKHKERTNVAELVDTVRLLKGSESYGSAVRQPLREFKRFVRILFPRTGWKERLQLIESDEDWRWVADLWPAVHTRRAKVLLMTSAKFFRPHDTLLEAAHAPYLAEWTRGSVIFMDEFDSIKQDCLKTIIDGSMQAPVDLAGLVRRLRSGLEAGELPETMLHDRGANSIERLRAMLDDTAESTCLGYVYKAEPGTTDAGGLFMYDGMRHSTNIGTSFHVRTDHARHENVITRRFHVGDDSRPLSRDIGRLRGAVAYAQKVICSLLVDQHGWGVASLDEEALRNEILSILEAIGIKDTDERRFMVEGVKAVIKSERPGRKTLKEGPSVYEQGFGLVALEDSEDHRYSTHLHAFAMDDTPEKMLLGLMRRSFVIGLSATLRIDSPLSNFDLPWLEEQEPTLMRRLRDADEKALRKAYRRHTEGYDNVELKVAHLSVKESKAEGLYRAAEQLVTREGLRESMMNALLGTVRSDEGREDFFPAYRYARVTRAYRYFLEHVEAGVFLCATTAAPRHGTDASTRYRAEVLEQLFDLVRRDLGMDAQHGAARFIEGSTDFQSRYDALVDELGPGCPRIFVCAAYGSLATGFNPQYDGRGMATVRVNDLSFDDRVDLVGVYLDRVTSIAPTIARIRKDSRGADVMALAFELREMAWRGDLSIDEMDQATKALMVGHPQRSNGIIDKPCVMASATKTVVQMVGRMCRTSNKAPTIHILFDDDLAKRIDPYALDKTLVGRETEELLKAVARRSTRDPEGAQGALENQIAIRTVATAGLLSKRAATRRWDEREMGDWEAMRLWCLANPTASPEDIAASRMTYFYVDTGQETTTYRYFEHGDFAYADISLKLEDTEDYPCEVSAHAARLEAIACVDETRKLFERSGWPLRWEPKGMLMNPATFRNVYLGALGEQAGRAILEARIEGLRLAEIEDGLAFEKFDFRIPGTDVYADLKNWRAPGMPGDDWEDRVREKMRKIGASHALVVNLMSSEDLRDRKCYEPDATILAVPYLIDDEAACVYVPHVQRIRSWLRKAGVL